MSSEAWGWFALQHDLGGNGGLAFAEPCAFSLDLFPFHITTLLVIICHRSVVDDKEDIPVSSYFVYFASIL